MAVLDGRGTKGERQLKWQVVPAEVLWQELLAMLGILGVEHGLGAQDPLPYPIQVLSRLHFNPQTPCVM